MKNYQIICHGVTVYACDAMIEAIAYFKHYAKRFGLNNVDLIASDDNIQTIRLIIKKEE